MFKDLYKQANDKIDTQDAKARVMQRLSQPAPVRKSYPVAKIATLAACFVLTVAAAGIYENMQKDTDNPLEIPSTNTAVVAQTDVPPVAAYSEPEAKAKPSVEKSATKKAGVVNETFAPVKPQDTADVLTDAAIPEAVTEIIAEPTPEAESAQQEPVTSGGGGGAATARSMPADTADGVDLASGFSLPTSRGVPVSAEEYCEYIGADIPKRVALPDGVKDETVPVQFVTVGENGEYLEDNFTFLFMGNGKSVQIETTKNTGNIQDKIKSPDYEKSKVCGFDAAVHAENGILQAYMAAADVGYCVTTVNCSEEELKNVLESLIN